MLYPIIRRVRRPLLPVEEQPVVVPVTDPDKGTVRDEKDESIDEEEKRGKGEEVNNAQEAAPAADVPAAAPTMELALPEGPVAPAPGPQELAKQTRTRRARRTKTEDPSC